jgi:hypothetical protein
LGYNLLTSLNSTQLPAASWRNLISLDVSYNQVTDIGSMAVALEALPNLHALVACGNPIALLSTYRAYILANIPQLEYLDDVRVSRSEQVGAGGVALSVPVSETTMHFKLCGLVNLINPIAPLPVDEKGEVEEEDPEAPIIKAEYYCTFNFPGPYIGVSPERAAAPTPTPAPAPTTTSTPALIPTQPAVDDEAKANVNANANAEAGGDTTAASVETATDQDAHPPLHNTSVPLAWAEVMDFNTTFTFVNRNLRLIKNVLLAGVTFEVYESVVESVVVVSDPAEGAVLDDGAKKDKKKDKKKGNGAPEVPLERKDLPTRVRCVGTAIVSLPDFLEGVDEVAKTLNLLDDEGNAVLKPVPPPSMPDTEAGTDADVHTPGLVQPEMVPLQLSVVVSLPRLAAPEANAGAQPEPTATEPNA